MNFFKLTIIFLICWFISPCLLLKLENIHGNNSSKAQLLFGGLFPIHSRSENGEVCGKINIERGIHRWQAMLFAVNQINKNPDILKNYTVNVDIHDTCQSDTIALEAVVKTVINKVRGGYLCSSELDGELSGKVLAGIIGAASSSISIEVANLLRLFRIPQISYASTSFVLNNRKKYTYFTRTVPPDTQQASAIMDLVKAYGWTSVFILYSDGIYGESGFEALKRKAKEKKICVVKSFKFTVSTNATNIISELSRYKTTKVVILFLRIQHIRTLLESASDNHASFTWVASDYWGTRHTFLNSDKLRAIANNAITLTLKANYSFKKFENYFCSLKPVLLEPNKSNRTNEWFNEYWLEKYNCSINSTACLEKPICHDVNFDDKIPYVIDAVYALASAADRVIKQSCELGVCTSELRGKDMLDSLLNYSYEGVYGETKFDQNGSASHGYDIMQYRDDTYIKIGSWNYTLKLFEYQNIVKSSCSPVDGCQEGFVRSRPGCCYKCIECSWNQYTFNDRCEDCMSGYRANNTRDGCEKLPIRHIQSSWVIAVASLAGLGIISTLLIILIFYFYKDTEVVRTSAPELSFPLLFGILLCYMLTFVIIADQTALLCGMRRFGLGFLFSICYSALLTKTNRLARVFNENRISRRAPRFITASSQVVIMSGLVFLEGGLAIIGLYINRPTLLAVEQNNATEVLFICEVPIYDKIIIFTYNFLLIAVCTFYAFRTRKAPACFNEAKYIGFVMFTTLIIWLSFVPLYSIDISQDSVTIALSMNVALNATSILAGLFGPKIYIIIFRPSRNRRSTSMCSFSQSHSIDNSEALRQRKMTSCSVFSDGKYTLSSSDT